MEKAAVSSANISISKSVNICGKSLDDVENKVLIMILGVKNLIWCLLLQYIDFYPPGNLELIHISLLIFHMPGVFSSKPRDLCYQTLYGNL